LSHYSLGVISEGQTT